MLGCRFPETNACAIFDFYIETPEEEKGFYLIEYDGIQHFKDGHFNSDLNIIHRNDLLKNKYCFKNNIPIIRIPFDKEYILNDLKPETTRFLLTPQNEKEYYESRG